MPIKLDEINRRVLNGEIDPQAARLVSDNFKWTAARLLPKVYGDKQQVDVTHEAGGSYLDLLQQVNKAAQLKHVDVVEHTEDTSDGLRARATEVNQIPVNNDMPKKQANRKKKGKKLSTGS